MEATQQKIVSDEGFLDSIRNLGLTTTDAVNEFVDNSFDHFANNVWITIFEEKGKMSMIVEDDGEGIAKEMIKKALAFGGRIPADRITTGRFGWGLSSGACCQSPKTELFSKIKGNVFFFNYIDLDELKKTSGYLPETTPKNPFGTYSNLHLKKESTSGTIIILKDLDQAERKKINSLAQHLSENLAVVQRKLLSQGKNIFINDIKVKFHDPLMLMDGFDGIEESGKGENYADIEPIIYTDIIDEKGNPARIEITISMLPVKKIMEKKLQRKSPFYVSPDNQGFYLMRHGRQIAGGQTLYLFTRHPMLNYFRGKSVLNPVLMLNLEFKQIKADIPLMKN